MRNFAWAFMGVMLLGVGCGRVTDSIETCTELKSIEGILEAKLRGCSSTSIKTQLIAQSVEIAASCGAIGLRCGDQSTEMFVRFRDCIGALRECHDSPIGDAVALTELLLDHRRCTEALAADLAQLQTSCR